jgi:hypothetical protein
MGRENETHKRSEDRKEKKATPDSIITIAK